jgi:hypothetical protein
VGVSRPARQQCQVLFEASALFVELLSGQTLVREWSRPLGVGTEWALLYIARISTLFV